MPDNLILNTFQTNNPPSNSLQVSPCLVVEYWTGYEESNSQNFATPEDAAEFCKQQVLKHFIASAGSPPTSET